MAGLSDSSEISFLNHNFYLIGGAYTAPTQHYISLHTNDPGDTGLNEVVGGSYARFLVSSPATFWSAASARTIQNTTEAGFPNMPAVTVTHCGVWDSPTAGTFMAGDNLGASRVVGAGDTARFQAGQLRILFDSTAYADYLANAWLNFQFRDVAYTRPTSHTLQIYDGDPTGAGTPIAGATPQAITFNPSAPSGTRQEVTNNGVITFSALTGGDTLDHWLIEDQLNNDLVFYNQTQQAIGAGDDVEFQDQIVVVGID